MNAAVETPSSAEWLVAARTDLAGDGLAGLVARGEGYTQEGNDDGSITSTGTVTVGALQSEDFGAFGLPVASQPGFKVDDPKAPVSLRVVVGRKGLIRELRLDWKLDRPGEESDWSYVAAYERLGAAPGITAPDPGRTVTVDNPFSDVPAGAL